MQNSMITSMIFFPEKTFYEKPEDYGFLSEDVTFVTEDGLKLFGWFLRSPSAHLKAHATILFFHGNAGNIANRLYKVKGWLERGFSVFLVDYRGYGKSEGEIRHQEDVLKDARGAFKWLAEKQKTPVPKIIFYGESLGTYPAIWLGTEQKAAAVILEAPFTSFEDLIRIHYPMVPAFVVKNFEFSNAGMVDRLKCPLFILHGTEDEICPYNMAGELFEKAPEPKGFLSIPGGFHNDLPMAAGEDYVGKPCEFVSRYLK